MLGTPISRLSLMAILLPEILAQARVSQQCLVANVRSNNMATLMRIVKTMPYAFLGVIMVISSRSEIIQYGMLLIVGSIIWLWAASLFNSKEET
jgi:hypothetical protein